MLYLISILGILVLFGIPAAGIVFWDKGRRSFALALRSLWLHKLRSSLSMLGIIIGTTAVITLMSFVEGNMHDALEAIKRQGATNIIVRSVKPPDEGATQGRSFVAVYGLTYKDYKRLQSISTVVGHVPMRVFPHQIRRGEYLINGRLVATTPQYADVNKLELLEYKDGNRQRSRFLTEQDDYLMRNVAVLGSTVAERLFPFENPLGQTVKLGSHNYVVVGVMNWRMPTGGSGGSLAAEDYNSDVYIPLQTCKVRFGERIYIRQSGSRSGEQVELHQITLTVSDIDQVRPTGEVVRGLLDGHLKKDWVVTVPLDKLKEAEETRNRYMLLAFVVAFISLLVGGIGIMNIMLATVTERTREIGIRRALGAKRRDITLQFLIEAVVETSVGGLLGVGLGVLAVLVLPPLYSWLTKEPLPFILHVFSIFLSVGVSIFVGVVFGLYPAWRAAMLDPIEALRHE